MQTLRLAAQKGMFTMAYCYNPQEARILARAGIDIIVSHVGLTAGGEVGVREVAALEETSRATHEILSAALEERPDIIPLCHGGAIVSPEDVQQVVDTTCAVGFVGASSIERLSVEGSVSAIAAGLRIWPEDRRDGAKTKKLENAAVLSLNCTPIVRQYDIPKNDWSAILFKSNALICFAIYKQIRAFFNANLKLVNYTIY